MGYISRVGIDCPDILLKMEIKPKIKTDFGDNVFVRGKCIVCKTDTFEAIKKGKKNHEIICEECKRKE